MSESFDLPDVDRFVAGAVGEPGRRTFFFQIGVGPILLALKCEKLHVSALAEAFTKMLVDLPPPAQSGRASAPPSPTGSSAEPDGSVGSVRPEWSVGSIGLGYEGDRDRIVVEMEEAVPPDEEGARARFSITRAQAAAFAARSDQLVRAGRPTCKLCSMPINPDGYTCHCFN